MSRYRPINDRTRKPALLGNLLDKIIHPLRDPEEDHDPGKPFTPPPSRPSKRERDDDDDDGPRFPMDPAVA